MTALNIRDSNAGLGGDFTTHSMPSGSLDIVGDDGRTLFTIAMKDGRLEVQSGHICKHAGVIYAQNISIMPHASNMVSIVRAIYEPNS